MPDQPIFRIVAILAYGKYGNPARYSLDSASGTVAEKCWSGCCSRRTTCFGKELYRVYYVAIQGLSDESQHSQCSGNLQ